MNEFETCLQLRYNIDFEFECRSYKYKKMKTDSHGR